MCLPFFRSEKKSPPPLSSPSSSPLYLHSVTTLESPSQLTSCASPSPHPVTHWADNMDVCANVTVWLWEWRRNDMHFCELHFFFFFFQARIQSSNAHTERHIFPSSQHTISVCVENSLSGPVKHFPHRDGMTLLLISLTMQPQWDNHIKDTVFPKQLTLTGNWNLDMMIAANDMNEFPKFLGNPSKGCWVISV